jgi:hypothetical protein
MQYGYSLRIADLNKKADGTLLGVKLGRVCIKNNVSVVEVSAQLRVSRQTVYNWFIADTYVHKELVDEVKEYIAVLQG